MWRDGRYGMVGARLMYASVRGLNTFDNTEVAFRARPEWLKCFLVCVAFVSFDGMVVGIEFDKNRTCCIRLHELESGLWFMERLSSPRRK